MDCIVHDFVGFQCIKCGISMRRYRATGTQERGSMKVYLAARYSMKNYLRGIAEELRQGGVEVTSSWIYTDWEIRETGSASAPPDHRAEWAVKDLEDVARCDVVVSFSCGGKGRGGRHAEFGYGLALYKTMVLIGEPEHIFHEHPHVVKFKSWSDFIESAALPVFKKAP